MLRPQYIKLVVSSNKNIQLAAPSQQASQIRASQLKSYCQGSFSHASNQFLHVSSTPLTNRVVTSSTPTTSGLSNQAISPILDFQGSSKESSLCDDSSTTKSNAFDIVPEDDNRTTQMPLLLQSPSPSGCKKRHRSPSAEVIQRSQKKINRKALLLLGQRPYNDDSLLLDSMKFEDELVEDVTYEDVSYLNSTQISEQVDESGTGEVDIEIIKSSTQDNLCDIPSLSNSISIPRRDTVPKINSSTQKTICKKKKKSLDPKYVNL
ncbi:unnamed protein product [Rotaria sp. Silwood2]|nr:unnamed protein product [Rotaria sp. Silwood2]